MQFGKFVEPMLLSEQERPFDDEDYIFELKYDGIRATLHADKSQVKVWSRRGNDMTRQFPELQDIAGIVNGKTIFDGEIVAFEKGHPSFSSLQKRNLLKNEKRIREEARSNPVIFVAFDCLYDHSSLLKKTLIERKKVLANFEDSEHFMKTKYISKNGKELFRKIKKMNLEGIVAKKKNSLYYTGVRTKEWIKIKNYQCDVFYVGGIVENETKASLLLGEYRGKNFHFVGKVSIERNNTFYEKIVKERPINRSPFGDYEDDEAKHLSPKFMCEIVFIERTPNGHLRQPVFKRALEKG